jgi:hypothetical protein
MNPRTLAILFVGMLLAAMMAFAIVTNGERMASTHDHRGGVIRAAAAADGGSHRSGQTDGDSARSGDHAGSHTLTDDGSHAAVGTPHTDGHTDPT